MSSLTTLARPYAKAAFELAQGEQALARWEEMLSLAGSIVVEKSMANLLRSPEVSSALAVNIITEAAVKRLTAVFGTSSQCWRATTACRSCRKSWFCIAACVKKLKSA